MNLWLLEKTVFDEMKTAVDAGHIPTAEQSQEMQAAAVEAAGDLPKIMSVVGNRAAIGIAGVLTDAPNWIAKWFGGGNTTYGEIQSALARAESDPTISEIVLQINSPGGQASADWVSTMDAIANAKKPVTASVGRLAASAAYGIAAQANKIIAQNRMSFVGSVGVVSSYYVSDSMVEITSSNAPEKRPDVTTEDGKSAVTKFLDNIESVFMSAISRGRNVTVETIKKDFGRGGIVLAGDAIKTNMIDSISEQETTTTAAVESSEEKKEFKIMDLNTLKAEHPAVYAEAVEAGKSEERDRVTAHLTLGEASGDMETATKAIKDGSTMTAAIQANYMAASMKKNEISARDNDEEDLEGADDTQAEGEDDAQATIAAQTMKELEKRSK